MILDTSALIAILFGEPESEEFIRLILEAEVCRISVVNRVELAIVLERQAKPETAHQAEVFLRRASIIEESVSLEQGLIARQAFHDFGRGRHKAGLNFGDCFAYALAKERREPLLFKGEDFARTDVRPARRSLS